MTAGARAHRGPGPVARLLLALVTFYRRGVSPLLGPRCRFAPTCSSYAEQALREHGALRGGWLAVRRVLRCHPFHPGGLDPVPARRRRAEDDGQRTVPRTTVSPAVVTHAVPADPSVSTPSPAVTRGVRP